MRGGCLGVLGGAERFVAPEGVLLSTDALAHKQKLGRSGRQPHIERHNERALRSLHLAAVGGY